MTELKAQFVEHQAEFQSHLLLFVQTRQIKFVLWNIRWWICTLNCEGIPVMTETQILYVSILHSDLILETPFLVYTTTDCIQCSWRLKSLKCRNSRWIWNWSRQTSCDHVGGNPMWTNNVSWEIHKSMMEMLTNNPHSRTKSNHNVSLQFS